MRRFLLILVITFVVLHAKEGLALGYSAYVGSGAYTIANSNTVASADASLSYYAVTHMYDLGFSLEGDSGYFYTEIANRLLYDTAGALKFSHLLLGVGVHGMTSQEPLHFYVDGAIGGFHHPIYQNFAGQIRLDGGVEFWMGVFQAFLGVGFVMDMAGGAEQNDAIRSSSYSGGEGFLRAGVALRL